MPLKIGYAFVYSGRSWKMSGDDEWCIEVYTPTGRETPVGWRVIDDVKCRVYRVEPGKRSYVAVVGR